MKWDKLNEVQQIEIDKDGFLSFDAQKVLILTAVIIHRSYLKNYLWLLQIRSIIQSKMIYIQL